MQVLEGEKYEGFLLFEFIVSLTVASFVLLSLANLLIWSFQNLREQRLRLFSIDQIRFIDFYLAKQAAGSLIEKGNSQVLIFHLKDKKSLKIYKYKHSLFQTESDKKAIKLLRDVLDFRVNYFPKSVQILFKARSPPLPSFFWNLTLLGVSYAK